MFGVRCFRNDPAKFKEDLLNIARTTLSSKILTQHKDHFANLAVEAVLRLKVCCGIVALHFNMQSSREPFPSVANTCILELVSVMPQPVATFEAALFKYYFREAEIWMRSRSSKNWGEPWKIPTWTKVTS